MTTQHQIIAFCVIALISVPLGTFVIIKTIKKLSSPPVNVLTRRGDIELGDYILPNNQNYLDLLESPPQIYDRFSNYITYYGDRVPSYYSGQHAPSYQTGGNPPSFHTIDRINCPLEDYIKLEIILIVLIFLSFLILWRMRNHGWFNNFIKRFLLIHQLEIRIF